MSKGYTERFDRALLKASELHRRHTRKGKDVPYIHHLMAVASLVGTFGGDEDQVIAALLHDAIEDCIGEVPTIMEDLRAEFGERVLSIVEGCTDAYTDPKPAWQARKEAYIAHLREEPADSPVLLVSLADKVHNAAAIVGDFEEVGEAIWDRFTASREQTIWYYASLVEVFEEKIPGPLTRRLRRLVEAMESMKE